MHSHSHLHRRHAGAIDKIADAVKGVIGEVKDHEHHHDNGGNGNGGRSVLDRLEIRDSDNQPGAAGTFVSIVYVTATPTFTGAIAGFSTVGPPSVAAPSSSPAPIVVPPQSSAAAPSNTPQPQTSSPAAAATSQHSQTTPSTSLVTSIKTSATDSSSSSTLISSPSQTSIPSSNTAADAAASSSPSSGVITNDSSSANSGMSGGAKAGIAIGVILGVLALLAGAFALYRLRKRRAEEAYVVEQNTQNEKNPFGDSAAAPAPATRQMQTQAPVLPALGVMGAAPVQDVERRAESPRNPFGPGAETVRDVPSSSGAAPGTSGTDTEKIALGAGLGAAAGVATAAAAKRTSVPAPLKINRSQSPALVAPANPSPAASSFSEASMASSAMAGAAAGGTVSKMHRVQMDFNPTMDDELKIRAGDIVEIMHEYDDGWCLCKVSRRNKEGVSRVDRGVVPRTCLSRLPLKPRNGQKRQGPPVAGASTAATSRAESPAQAPQAPSGLSNAVPRSTSSALNANPVKRSVSPGPYGGGPQSKVQSPVARSRSNSMSDMKQARKEAPGPSPMNPSGAESKDITLPIQFPALSPALAQSQTSSIPSSPVTRKPVPKKQE